MAGLNINLINNVNPSNDNNSYMKRQSKKMSLISPKNSALNHINLLGNTHSNKDNLANLKLKREIIISVNSKVDDFEKLLTKIFKNENYFFHKKNASSEEKKRSSNRLLTEVNVNNINNTNINNEFTNPNANITREKSRYETQPTATNNYTSRKSILLNQPLLKKKSLMSNHSQINRETSNINQIINNNLNSHNVQIIEKNQQGNLHNNNNLNGSFLSNHISGYSELLNYFKENNLSLNKFAELFYLLNSQFNLINNMNTNNSPYNTNNQENQNLKSNYNSNTDNQSISNEVWNNYSVFLGKGYKYKLISRDKVKPYRENKNNLNFIFILEGKNSDLQKFYEDLNLVLTETLINKINDEFKLSSNILEKRINNFLNEKIFTKSDNVNLNYNNLFNNILQNNNNINISSQIFYNLYNNFSVIQEESNNNNLINSNTVASNTVNNNVISNNQVSQLLHRNSTLSSNNNPLKRKTSIKSNNLFVEEKLQRQGSGNLYPSSPSKQYNNNQFFNNITNSYNPNSPNTKSNSNNNGNFQFNQINIHNLINIHNNPSIAENLYNIFLKGELANFPLLSSKFKFILKATRLHPEKNQKGVFIIDQRKSVEFHALINDPKKKSLKFNLDEVKFVMKYRYLYEYKALNLYLHNYKKPKVLIFESEKEANDILVFMFENCERLDKMKYDIKTYTNLWIDGYISNFDYLIYLNEMANRSFSDMSQYPVMPWVINNFNDEDFLDIEDESNYRDLSKPIGAQNPLKLKNFREFYKESKEDNEIPYFYGTHYSTPTLVIFYLSRSHPLFNLRLQAGGFGPADRLFQSLKLTWETVFNPGTDVMELIPEFYSGDGSFLKNSLSLDLGKTQAGRVVSDVLLPKWANNSTNDFINIMRSALESDYVSENLHNWIDLIFGYKQTGEKAAENDNLFHHFTYEENINLENFSEAEKNSLMIQILEFGQTPKQLFKSPHPKKRIRQSYLFNDQILQSPLRDYMMKFHKTIKDKEILESKYEKIRRIKEEEKETLLKEFEKEAENYRNKKKEIIELIAKKETEFKSYVETLLEQNKTLRENFQVYDKNKDHVFNKWIRNLKKTHMVKVEEELGEKANLIKHINQLENNLDKHKIKELDLNMNIEDKKKKIEENENEIKELKKSLYDLQRVLRKIPHEKQIYLNQPIESTNLSCNSMK